MTAFGFDISNFAPPSFLLPEDPVSVWRDSFVRLVAPRAPRLLKAVSFADVFAGMRPLFPEDEYESPGLLEYRDVLWFRGKGALYDGINGLALPGTFVTRFPRQRQSPHCSEFRVELSLPLTSFPSLESAALLPFAFCGNFGHFITETTGGLWPFFCEGSFSVSGMPVVLPGCVPDEPLAKLMISGLHSRNYVPLIDSLLPDVVRINCVHVPEPSLRLHAGSSRLHVDTARAMACLLPDVDEEERVDLRSDRVFVSRSALSGRVRRVEEQVELESALTSLGWQVFHPEQHSLSVQLDVYRSARVLAGFEGSAFHGLSFLGQISRGPKILLLGDCPSPDYFFQFRAQGAQGFFVQCTEFDSDSCDPLHLRRRRLALGSKCLADFVNTLAKVF